MSPNPPKAVEWVDVPFADLDEDGRAVIRPNGHEIAVFLIDGKPHAFANTCPHEGNPLVEGELLGSTLTCAYHSWKFDLETGACLFGEEAAQVYPAELEGDAIRIRLE